MKRPILLSAIFTFLMCNLYSRDFINVTSPAYCSNVNGNTTINISAPNFPSVTVYCWKQGAGFGSNSTVGTVALTNGVGSIVFPADDYPHGPITVKISGTSPSNSDNCYLQLYNEGGVSWNEGIPADPPAAAGMNLVFFDDFNSMPTIGDAPNTTYYDHKPPYGSQDFSYPIPFTNYNSVKNPFEQMGTYLRIRADANKNSTGLISSLKSDKSGFHASVPCYFECRFIAPNAIGTWPAFWLHTVKDVITNHDEPCDEIDIIEAYGGEGPGAPNAGQRYQVALHAWLQTGRPKEIEDEFWATYNPVFMNDRGIPSTWYESPHVYGCKIDHDYTIYYCDNIEVGRHETLPISKTKPHYFMINLAVGGGWPVDLSRYNGLADMYVDYVRVYSDDTPKPVEGITLTTTSTTLKIGGNQELQYEIIPANATNRDITWSSSNTDIVTVNPNGKITGVGQGSATVKATTNDGGFEASCNVNVTLEYKLTGTVIGTLNSGDNGREKAFDGNTATYTSIPDAAKTGAWTGLDLNAEYKISSIRYYPRAGFMNRMVGGKFQGSNTADFSAGVVDLHVISEEPLSEWNDIAITEQTAFRYVRYITPPSQFCYVAEIEFYSNTEPTSINETRLEKNSMIIYPNPASDFVYLFPPDGLSNPIETINVYDFTGKLVSSKEINIDAFPYQLKMSQLNINQLGSYIMEMITKDKAFREILFVK